MITLLFFSLLLIASQENPSSEHSNSISIGIDVDNDGKNDITITQHIKDGTKTTDIDIESQEKPAEGISNTKKVLAGALATLVTAGLTALITWLTQQQPKA